MRTINSFLCFPEISSSQTHILSLTKQLFRHFLRPILEAQVPGDSGAERDSHFAPAMLCWRHQSCPLPISPPGCGVRWANRPRLTAQKQLTLPGHKAGSLVHDIPDLWRGINNPHHWLRRSRILLWRSFFFCGLWKQEKKNSILKFLIWDWIPTVELL